MFQFPEGTGFPTGVRAPTSFVHRALYGEAVSEPVILNHRRIFILPTRYGLVFGLVLFVMLLGSINYNNSPAHLLTFLLGSLALVSILHAYRNLAGLIIRTGSAEPVFAGGQAQFPLLLDNHGGVPRYALDVRFGKQAPVICDLASDSRTWTKLPLAARDRGRLYSGAVTLSTRFPLGLFRSWTRLDLGMWCLVYPRPGPFEDWPSSQATGGSRETGHEPGMEDFVGLRAHAPGDSPRHIHWKAAARDQELLTKRFGAEADEDLWLDWQTLPSAMNMEARLSRLCRWVLEAHAAGRRYGLRLPDGQFGPGHGEPHLHRCLEALALFGEEPFPKRHGV
jgi:uncharacterized protein (DUF58 family)